VPFTNIILCKKRIIYLLLHIEVIKVNGWRDGEMERWVDEVAIII
jgi:hypothetical protein